MMRDQDSSATDKPEADERRLLEAAAWLLSCTPEERDEARFYADLECYKVAARRAESALSDALTVLRALGVKLHDGAMGVVVVAFKSQTSRPDTLDAFARLREKGLMT